MTTLHKTFLVYYRSKMVANGAPETITDMEMQQSAGYKDALEFFKDGWLSKGWHDKGWPGEDSLNNMLGRSIEKP